MLPDPKETPIEVDTGGLHARPEVDFGYGPATPLPNDPPEPERAPEREEPETDPA